MRSDLVLEFNGTLNASGAYTSAWIDTAEVGSVSVWWTDGASGSADIQHSQDGSTNIRSSAAGIGATIRLYARYFRFVHSGGTANAAHQVSLRAA